MRSIFLIFLTLLVMNSVCAEVGEGVREEFKEIRYGNFHEDEYNWEMRATDGMFICKRTMWYDLGKRVETVPNKDCEDNIKNRYALDQNGVCLLLTSDKPPRFIRVEKNKKRCPEVREEFLASSNNGNLVQAVQNQMEVSCRSLGNCINSLSDKNTRFVNNIVDVLRKINFKSKYKNLKDNVSGNKFAKRFYEFRRALKNLERQRSACTAKYGQYDANIYDAELSLTKDLAAMSDTLTHDVFVFHWFDNLQGFMSADEQPKDSMRGRWHASALQNNYFSGDWSDGTGMQGRGLYAARNPTYTQNYGNMLLKIQIPKGSRYLDIEGETKGGSLIILSEDTFDKLAAAGCNLDKEEDTSRGKVVFGVKKYKFSSDDKCSDIFNKIIQKEKYIFQTYNYGKAGASFCDNYKSEAAFVFIQHEFTSENTELFFEPFPGNDSKRARKDIPEELLGLYDASSGYDAKQEWKDRTAESKESVSKKWKSNLYACDEKVNPNEFPENHK